MKRGCLGKDSFLGKLRVNLIEINLDQLIGGLYLTIPYSLSYNRYLVNVSSLTNSRVNSFVFINILLAIDIATFFNLKFQRLPKLISIKGYNSKLGTRITHFLRIYLTINKRRQYNIPLLILKLRSYNLILSRKQLEYFNLLLDIRN